MEGWQRMCDAVMFRWWQWCPVAGVKSGSPYSRRGGIEVSRVHQFEARMRGKVAHQGTSKAMAAAHNLMS
jgi:hypothetical protein